jgi:hypothetical protein
MNALTNAGALEVLGPPTREELDKAWTEFDADWGGVVETLYGLCTATAEDAGRRPSMAKIILINRAYNARLEAKIRPEQGQRAVELIGEFVDAYGERLRDAVAAIPRDDCLTVDTLRIVVEQHAEVTRLFAMHLTHGASMKSFVSKYLHFHRPVVPIYDSQCEVSLKKRVQGPVGVAGGTPVDVRYAEFCTRFLVLYEDCRRRGLPATVKKLDALLWRVPG